jgi:hypothetical protein
MVRLVESVEPKLMELSDLRMMNSLGDHRMLQPRLEDRLLLTQQEDGCG